MTADEVRQEMVDACVALGAIGRAPTQAQWQRSMDRIYKLWEQLPEEERRDVDLEPLIMMDPRLSR